MFRTVIAILTLKSVEGILSFQSLFRELFGDHSKHWPKNTEREQLQNELFVKVRALDFM